MDSAGKMDSSVSAVADIIGTPRGRQGKSNFFAAEHGSTTTVLSQQLLAHDGKSLFSLAAISKLNWLSPVLRPRIVNRSAATNSGLFYI
jgi:hypothetical protein